MERPGRNVCLTVDVEPDCPPYLARTFRGVERGLGRLLALLDEEGIEATFFVTGEVASRYPRALEGIVSRGHELGSHGYDHRPFPTMGEWEAREDIQRSVDILSRFAPVASFRAPNLVFPGRLLGLLVEAGIRIDSSIARYKKTFEKALPPTGLVRVPVSVTSSVLRLPGWIRDPWLKALSPPVVLYVHPWEFVDLRRERLRWDCRFRTGDAALERLRSALGLFRRRGARFHRLDALYRKDGRADEEAGSRSGGGR